jgi:hypothetical protein
VLHSVQFKKNLSEVHASTAIGQPESKMTLVGHKQLFKIETNPMFRGWETMGFKCKGSHEIALYVYILPTVGHQQFFKIGTNARLRNMDSKCKEM